VTINDCISLAEWDAMAPKIREALVQMRLEGSEGERP